MEIEFRQLVKQAIGSQPVEWGNVNQGTAFPYVTLNTISDIEGYHQRGPDRLSAARVQIDMYDTTYGKVKVASNKVRDALSGYRGGSIQGIFLDTVRDFNEAEGTDAHFRVSMDFIVNYERS